MGLHYVPSNNCYDNYRELINRLGGIKKSGDILKHCRVCPTGKEFLGTSPDSDLNLDVEGDSNECGIQRELERVF